MRRLLLLGALLAAGAVGFAALPPASPRADARADAPAAAPGAAGPRAQLFLVNGPLATSTEHGARLPIANGWIEARLANFPPGPRAQLDVLVISRATKAPARAEVVVSYEMAEMDHGTSTERAVPGAAGHHAATLDLWMLDVWRVTIRVVLDGVASDVVLLVAPP